MRIEVLLGTTLFLAFSAAQTANIYLNIPGGEPTECLDYKSEECCVAPKKTSSVRFVGLPVGGDVHVAVTGFYESHSCDGTEKTKFQIVNTTDYLLGGEFWSAYWFSYETDDMLSAEAEGESSKDDPAIAQIDQSQIEL